MLVLSYFPQSLCGQILGVNLYLRNAGLLPAFGLVAHNDRDVRQFLDLGLNPADRSDSARDDSIISALSYAQDRPGGSGLEAVVAGFQWARHHVEELHENLHAVLEAWRDPRQAARQLVWRRRREALAYHAGTRLDGQPMQELLSADSPTELLDRLAASPYVRSGDPDRSPLLNGLISPRGKMFRVFSRDDVSVLRRWITGLPYPAAGSVDTEAYRAWSDVGGFDKLDNHERSGRPLRLSAREAYPRLLNVELAGSEVEFARTYIEQWLGRASRGMQAGACALPSAWSVGALRMWLHQQHEASNRLASTDDTIPTRDDVVADVLSLAPLTMIDGAWLAGFSHPAVASTPSGYALFDTFYDELGNGIEKLNHPIIYRDLLRVVHGDLPATADPAYANSACFRDRDFELPVFWLSIGRFPQTYRAEVLGLNLAMELSGVGGGYLRTQRALKAHGFPTLFVDLHNTIDNIATGHSAWAAASIDAFMSALPERDRVRAWDRVRTGFVALNPPDERSTIKSVRDKVKALL